MANKEDEGVQIGDFAVGFGEAPTVQADTVPEASRLVVAMACQWSPSGDECRSPAAVGELLRVTKASLSDAMAKVPPLLLRLEDPVRGPGHVLDVEVPLGEFRGLRPKAMVAAIDVLQRLAASAEALEGDNPQRLPGIWQDHPWQGQFRGQASAPAAAAPADGLDSLLSMVEVSEAPTAPAGVIAGDLGPARVAGRLLASITQHPAIRYREALWRELRKLFEEAGDDLEVHLIQASADETEAALSNYFSAGGAQQAALITIRHGVEPSAASLARANGWAELAERWQVPIIAEATSGLLGFASLTALAETTGRFFNREHAQAVAFRSFQSKEATRWLALVANGVVAREAYTLASGGLARLDFCEDQAAHLYFSPLLFVTLGCFRSYADTGWACGVAGKATAWLGGLQTVTEGGRSRPIEALVSDQGSRDGYEAGIGLGVGERDGTRAYLPRLPMAYRGRPGPSGTSPKAEQSVADQLFVAQVAKTLQQLGAELPKGTPPAKARDVVQLIMCELLGSGGPRLSVRAEATPPAVSVAIEPRGFLGVTLEGFELSIPL